MIEKIQLITTSNYLSKKQEALAIENAKKIETADVCFDRIKHKFRNRWAGSPALRTKQFEEAFNSAADVIWNCLGGSGCIQFIDQIKFNNIKPKIVIGSSDFTLLANQLSQNKAMLVINGPNASTKITQPTLELIKKIIANEKVKCKAKVSTNEHTIVQAETAGGNLISTTWLLGSQFEVDFRNKIAVFDKLGKGKVSTFNNFIQLQNSSKFSPKAIVITKLPQKGRTELIEMLKFLFPTIPVLYDLQNGSKGAKMSFPLGRDCLINTKAKTIEF